MQISPFEALPRDIFTEMRPYLRVKTFFRLSSVSTALHKKILSVFADNAEALSLFCSQIVKYPNSREALRAVRGLQKPDAKLPVCLRTKVHYFANVERLIADLPDLDSLIVTNDRDCNVPGKYHLPRCTKLTLGRRVEQDSFFLAEQKSLTTLKIQRVIVCDELTPLRIQYLENNAALTNGDRSIEDWQSYFRIRSTSTDKLSQFVELHPHFIPAKLRLVACTSDDEKAISILQEVVWRHRDLARPRFLLGQRLYKTDKEAALFHLNHAVELYKKEGAAEGLFDIALLLQSIELAHLAYELLPQMSVYRDTCIKQFLELDPRHIAARLEKLGHSRSTREYFNETFVICIQEEDYAGLMLLCWLAISNQFCQEVAEEAFKQFSKTEPRLYSSLFSKMPPPKRSAGDDISSFLYCIDVFLDKKRPIDSLLRYFLVIHNTGIGSANPIKAIYWHLLKKELRGAPLFDLSILNELYPATHVERPDVPQLLHRLERRIRCEKSKLYDQVSLLLQYENESWWIYLFLKHHNLLPEVRIHFLKKLVVSHAMPFDTNAFTYAKQFAETTLIAIDQPYDFFDLGDDTTCLAFNARIELAKTLLLIGEQGDAIAIFRELILHIEHFTNYGILKAFYKLFVEFDLLPETRDSLLRTMRRLHPERVSEDFSDYLEDSFWQMSSIS